MSNDIAEVTIAANLSKNFRYDESAVDWKAFITDGCFYRILDVNVPARTADMLVKFDAGARCLHHRHVAATTSLVLQGELHIFEQSPAGEIHKVKPAGTFTVGTDNEVHIEGGGDDGVIVYFSMRGTTDRIYDFMSKEGEVKRAITIQDFARDFESWAR